MGMDVGGTGRVQQTQSQVHLVTSPPHAGQEQTLLDRIRRVEIRHRCNTPTSRLQRGYAPMRVPLKVVQLR